MKLFPERRWTTEVKPSFKSNVCLKEGSNNFSHPILATVCRMGVQSLAWYSVQCHRKAIFYALFRRHSDSKTFNCFLISGNLLKEKASISSFILNYSSFIWKTQTTYQNCNTNYLQDGLSHISKKNRCKHKKFQNVTLSIRPVVRSFVV